MCWRISQSTIAIEQICIYSTQERLSGSHLKLLGCLILKQNLSWMLRNTIRFYSFIYVIYMHPLPGRTMLDTAVKYRPNNVSQLYLLSSPKELTVTVHIFELKEGSHGFFPSFVEVDAFISCYQITENLFTNCCLINTMSFNCSLFRLSHFLNRLTG